MELSIQHELPGRIRFSVLPSAAAGEADHRIRSALATRTSRFRLTFNPNTKRFLLICDDSLSVVEIITEALLGPAVETDERAFALRAQNRPPSMAGLIVSQVFRFLLARVFTPPFLSPLTLAVRIAPPLKRALERLPRHPASIEILDAAAILTSLATRDFNAARLIAFLLELAESVEDWTREGAREDLLGLYQSEEQTVWRIGEDGAEAECSERELREGDLVVARAGFRIPVDGDVQSGNATVDQSAMTGESVAVAKLAGHWAFAGTTVQEGELIVRAKNVGADTRLARIARVIANAEEQRGELQGFAERLSNRLVPLNLALGVGVFLLTRNLARTAAVLAVDYSCALKLTTPLVVMSAMEEALQHGVLVKGGRYLEKAARADVFVLDKTGTLTHAEPTVVDVVPFNGFERDFVLRNTACLEEHFPHPLARAVVAEAMEQALSHPERHAKVQYIVAHGIISTLDGNEIMVGSRHFVSEDHGVDVSAADAVVEAHGQKGHSVLYTAVGNTLAGIIAVADPPLPSAPELIRKLEERGQRRIMMLTGDNENSAAYVAKRIGVSEFRANVLPDEKSDIVRALQKDGHTVAMVGDGVNDSPALAVADLGISFNYGADITREASDIIVLEGGLDRIPTVLEISQRAVARIHRNFRWIVGLNSAFTLMGIFGVLPSGVLALFHNSTTVAISVMSTRPLLKRR